VLNATLLIGTLQRLLKINYPITIPKLKEIKMADLGNKPLKNQRINLYKCAGCPCLEECPIGIIHMSNECKELLKAKGEM
jgi:formate hydrogenlyase subunit 6/NADH:ubiquinone oxidoreductase subunit I